MIAWVLDFDCTQFSSLIGLDFVLENADQAQLVIVPILIFESWSILKGFKLAFKFVNGQSLTKNKSQILWKYFNLCDILCNASDNFLDVVIPSIAELFLRKPNHKPGTIKTFEHFDSSDIIGDIDFRASVIFQSWSVNDNYFLFCPAAAYVRNIGPSSFRHGIITDFEFFCNFRVFRPIIASLRHHYQFISWKTHD